LGHSGNQSQYIGRGDRPLRRSKQWRGIQKRQFGDLWRPLRTPKELESIESINWRWTQSGENPSPRPIPVNREFTGKNCGSEPSAQSQPAIFQADGHHGLAGCSRMPQTQASRPEGRLAVGGNRWLRFVVPARRGRIRRPAHRGQ